MKITKVEHWTEHLELTRPYTIAYETIEAVDNHFVRIDTEEGLFGIGAASPGPEVTGESIDDCRNALQTHLESLLLAQDVRHLNALVRKLQDVMPAAPAARAAVDMALYDLMAGHLEMPLVELLGRVHRSLPTSITIGIESIEESLEEAREYLGRGFRILKVKIGKSIEDDLERLHRLRENLGRQTAIRVDINQGYSVKEYKQFIEKTHALDLEFIEQPLKAPDIEGMRQLPEAVRAKTAADESLIDAHDALRYTCPPRPFGIYNIKLMKCGGIFPALQIAGIADCAGIELMWGCNDESIVAISAALHAALSSPATRYLDLDGSLDLARDLVEGGFVLKEGELSVTDRPGLGVTLM
jgi:L-alanine-DL-glutamate epimerase-like enolase superfamily enzyme